MSSVAANEGSRGVDSGHEARKKDAQSRARSQRDRKPDEESTRSSPVSRVGCVALPCVFGGEARFGFRRRVSRRMQSTHIPAGLGGMPAPHTSIGRARGRVAAEPRTSWLRWPGVRGSLGTAATTAGRKRMVWWSKCVLLQKSYEGSPHKYYHP